ncbi:hypothetical protein ACFE04_001045 [Oxalis oulophora]
MVGVVLGMAGQWADDYRQPSDHFTSKIGGLPDWPFPKSALKPGLLNCAACGTPLILVAQIYAPVMSIRLKIEERFLLVFGCLASKCGTNKWKALRVQRNDSTKELCTTPVSKVNWWDDESDDEDMDLTSLAKALSEAGESASKSNKPQSRVGKNLRSEKIVTPLPSQPRKREEDLDTPVLPCFYIWTKEEPSSRDVSSLCSNYSSLSIKETKFDTYDNGHKEKWEEERYEYDKALTADRTYLKFKKKVDAHQEQCFRYQYGGKPVLAKKNVGNPGKCKSCGQSRHFEMQLMPSLIYFLHEAAEDSQKVALDNWNWMTLLVYACSKSCSNQEKVSINGEWTISEEAVVVQYEEQLDRSAQLAYFS